MSEFKLLPMEDDLPPGKLSCGVRSIDERILSAYSMTLFKQAKAFNITLDQHIIGNCMVKFLWIEDEDAEYYVETQDFAALEISYIAIDQRLQGQRFGSIALDILLQELKAQANVLPIRYLVLDAFQDKVAWYKKFEFEEYEKPFDYRAPNTVPMRLDLIDLERAEDYCNRNL